MLDLIHYGGGNVGSIARCLQRMAEPFQWIKTGQELSGKNPIVLPGVGAFGAVVEALTQRDLILPLTQKISNGTPYLGICVGLQILFSRSEESPRTPGLDLVPGQVLRFKKGKVPQIGWNQIRPGQNSGYVSGYAYFVNSYYAHCDVPEAVLFSAHYGVDFCAGVQTGNITAFQFHPEKSGEFGQDVLRRWLDAL